MKLQSVFVAALVGFGFNAEAQPVPPPIVPAFLELDLQTIGDKLVTYDTETRLEWLDVRLNERVSFDQALLTSYVVEQGFRHATDSEVRELLANFGITVAYRPQDNYEPILRMLALLGPGYNSGTYEVLSGVYKANSSNPIDAGWLSVSVGLGGPGEGGQVAITTDVFMHTGEPLDGTGNFLVRRIDVGTRLQQLLTLSTNVGPGKLLLNNATTVQTNYVATCTTLSNYREQISALRRRLMVTQIQNDALRGAGLAILSATGCE